MNDWDGLQERESGNTIVSAWLDNDDAIEKKKRKKERKHEKKEVMRD